MANEFFADSLQLLQLLHVVGAMCLFALRAWQTNFSQIPCDGEAGKGSWLRKLIAEADCGSRLVMSMSAMMMCDCRCACSTCGNGTIFILQ
jgi:hypothetical protein